MSTNASLDCRPIEILMAEDSPTDVLMAREALKQAKVCNLLHVVEDGVEAMEFLKRKGSYADASPPDLILLDLNMPRKNGREVLEEIKGDPRFKHIPVAILTTSKDEEDVLRAYKLHANCYIAKPVDFTNFVSVVKSFEDFWLSVVTLPPKGDPPRR